MVLANILYDTGNIASTFSRWNEVDLPLVAPAASPRSCGRCLHVYCIIKFPHAIFEITFLRIAIAATKVQFSSLYAACVALSNDTRNALFTYFFFCWAL